MTQLELPTRRATGCERILRLLEAHRGEWVADLYQRTFCIVHSRVADLRRQGYRIEKRCFGVGDYRYRLLPSEPKATLP